MFYVPASQREFVGSFVCMLGRQQYFAWLATAHSTINHHTSKLNCKLFFAATVRAKHKPKKLDPTN